MHDWFPPEPLAWGLLLTAASHRVPDSPEDRHWLAKLLVAGVPTIVASAVALMANILLKNEQVTRIEERQAAVLRRLEVIEREQLFRRQLNDSRTADLDHRLDAIEQQIAAHAREDMLRFERRK